MRFLERTFVLASSLACAALVMLAAHPAEAEPIPMLWRAQPKKNWAGITFGTEGTWSLSLNYARSLRLKPRNFLLQLDAALTVPLPQITSFDAARLRGGASALFYARNGLGVSAGLGPDVTYGRDALTNTFGFGAEAYLRPGYWGKNGQIIMLDVRYRMGYSTCILHRNAFPDLYGDRYPGAAPAGAPSAPQDGCLPMTVHRLRTGLLLGGSNNNYGGYLAGGFQFNPNLDGVISSYPLTALPFYLEIGLAVGL